MKLLLIDYQSLITVYLGFILYYVQSHNRQVKSILHPSVQSIETTCGIEPCSRFPQEQLELLRDCKCSDVINVWHRQIFFFCGRDRSGISLSESMLPRDMERQGGGSAFALLSEPGDDGRDHSQSGVATDALLFNH